MAFGLRIGSDELTAEPESYGRAILPRSLREALEGLSPDLRPEVIDKAYRRVTWPEISSLVANNNALHRMLVDRVAVRYHRLGEPFAGPKLLWLALIG